MHYKFSKCNLKHYEMVQTYNVAANFYHFSQKIAISIWVSIVKTHTEL